MINGVGSWVVLVCSARVATAVTVQLPDDSILESHEDHLVEPSEPIVCDGNWEVVPSDLVNFM
ncbi:hypothetical protein A3F38_01865 [Candidatus Saccharibacteria bacterium RIFCSPHIGHO2_12_FULL_48_21]|nr:MAG: hypothetical protein A3F38_01865 [Candidatus Saccharibacteria bacterium RIFCSPHIGHO2_12_FULL_48_21]